MRGAVHAAVHRTVGLDSVADDATSAMRALRRQGVDRAFEAVEDMTASAVHNLK
jgi:hypothetical protein